MPNFKVHYIVRCTNCRKISLRTNDKDFISVSFLPQFCEGCGEYRARTRFPYKNEHWVIEAVKQKWIKEKFNLLKPLTWFGQYKTVDIITFNHF